MSERPKEGIYLDAALGVIGEQVEERIDEIVRRRRIRARLGMAALGVLTVTSGSVAAVALTSTLATTAPTAAETSAPHTAQVRCIVGDDIEATPFFTVTYRAHADAAVDEEALCLGARRQLTTEAAALARATPEELIAAAEVLLLEVSDAADAVVEEASYGVPPTVGGADRTGTGVCVDGSTTTILLGAVERAVGGLWTVCPGSAG